MFSGSTRFVESEQTKITLHDIESKILKQIVDFIYTSEIKVIYFYNLDRFYLLNNLLIVPLYSDKRTQCKRLLSSGRLSTNKFTPESVLPILALPNECCKLHRNLLECESP